MFQLLPRTIRLRTLLLSWINVLLVCLLNFLVFIERPVCREASRQHVLVGSARESVCDILRQTCRESHLPQAVAGLGLLNASEERTYLCSPLYSIELSLGVIYESYSNSQGSLDRDFEAPVDQSSSFKPSMLIPGEQ